MDIKDPAYREPRAKTRAELAREALLEAMRPEAAFDGWNDKTLHRAAKTANLSIGEVELYCPCGVLDIIQTWSYLSDQSARQLIEDLEPGRIRDRITQSVLIRLAQYNSYEEAVERARARLLLPDGMDLGARLVWTSSDMIWRAIGDPSTDGNFYSKRAILSGVYSSTLAIWLNERAADKPKTRAFLDRRIDNVMQFEKLKGRWQNISPAMPSLTQTLSRLRYGLNPR